MTRFRQSTRSQLPAYQYAYGHKTASGVCMQSASDYSPFGVLLDGRSMQKTRYRYGFGGMEKDDEVKGEGNSYTTEFRQLDPRVGRWLSLDPLLSEFPWQSPYCSFDNNPIYYTDKNGDASGGPGDPPIGDICDDESGATRVYKGDGEWASPAEFKSWILARINANEQQISAIGSSLRSNNENIVKLETEATAQIKTIARLESEHQALEEKISQMELTFNILAINLSSYNGLSVTSPNEVDRALMRARREWEARSSGACTPVSIVQPFLEIGQEKLSGGLESAGIDRITAQYTSSGIMFFGTIMTGRIGGVNIPIYRVYGGGAGRFGNYWTPINPNLYGTKYRNFAGLPNNNSGSFTLRGTVKIKDISGIGLAAPLDGNFGRGVLELRIENSWNKVNWSPRSVSRSKY